MNAKINIWRSVLAIVLGLVLVIWPDVALNYIVIFLGVILLVGGVVVITSYFASKRHDVEGMFPVGATVSSLVGLLLILFPSFFVSVLMFILGVLLAVAAISEVSTLVKARKIGFSIPLLSYVFPVIILIGGIIVMIDPFETAATVFILFGITAMVYGVTDLYNQYTFLKKK